MKHAIISLAIAVCVAVLGPHNLSELGMQITRAGILIVRLGMALEPLRAREDWYDAGDNDNPIPYLEEAHASIAQARA